MILNNHRADLMQQQPKEFRHASFRGRFGIAQSDITPPVGVHSRTWGAAEHEVADSIHRPLTLTAMVIKSTERESPLVLICADLSYWKTNSLIPVFHSRIREALSLQPDELIFAVSHSHATPPLMDPEGDVPGGDLIRQWMQSLPEIAIQTVQTALQQQFDGLLEWHIGRCGLAAVRDFPDPAPGSDRYLCGYAPEKRADDTLLVGRLSDLTGKQRGTVVNYACHPTTLAWENTSVSPDYIGAMRETIEKETQAHVFFLLGMCGELAPRSQYTGDVGLADRHGKQLGHAVLATLYGMEPPGQALAFTGVMESGAPLAVWRNQPTDSSSKLISIRRTVEVPMKEWPTAAELAQQISETPDRFQQERLGRRLAIRKYLGDEKTYALEMLAWRVGEVVFIGSSGEAYSVLQQELRKRFPDTAIVCMNLINGSNGYLPPADLFQYDIYPVWQTPFAAGCLENTLTAAEALIHDILA